MCIFPPIQYLNELYNDSPNATWLLPFRNVTKWIDSLYRWGAPNKRLKDRIATNCDLPEVGFFYKNDNDNDNATKGENKTNEDFITLFCNHVQQIRGFVNAHPTLSLVEFSIEDPKAGEYLASLLPGVDSTGWGQANAKERIRSTNK